MKLHYTPKSHFARKNRIVIDALIVERIELDVELIDAGNVADNSTEIFANNPLMKVPTLIDATQAVYESDHIAQYIVRKFDSSDRFDVLTTDPQQLNARAVMNGVMTAEVELIMADRTGIDTQAYSRFDKFRASVKQGLDWLENHSDLFSGKPSYAGFHLVCLWDHLLLYNMFSLNYPELQSHVNRLSKLAFVSKSAPF